jgi:hypothetical protein
MSTGYSRANIFNLSLFAGLVAGTGIIVALIYGALYGFNYMGQEVVGASRVLVAAYNTPPGNMNVAGAFSPPMQPGYPYGQGAVYGTAPQTGQYGYGYPQAVTAGPAAGQYVCPLHGGVGLPNVDPRGFPTCPICGQCMRFNCMSANMAPQMGGGTTAPQFFTPMQGQIGAGNIWNPAAAAAFNRGAG